MFPLDNHRLSACLTKGSGEWSPCLPGPNDNRIIMLWSCHFSLYYVNNWTINLFWWEALIFFGTCALITDNCLRLTE